jgi:hypothetical protein
MAKALLITRDDIVKKTALNGNVDVDLFIQFVNIAQDTHIQNYLGTRLLEKLQALISAGTVDVAGNLAYKTLLLEYVKPMLIHWAMVEYLPFGAYTIANKGIYKHGSENSESISKNEIDYLIEKQRQIAEHYTTRFIDFICFQTATYPEYNTNSNGDMYPDTDTNFTGWVI